MNYINPNSKKGIVNKFADFILCEINKTSQHKTKIQVTLFDTFLVLDGNTTSNTLLDVNKLKQDFFEKNKELMSLCGIERLNIIDILKYNTDFITPPEQCFEFYKTERPIFNSEIIEYSYPKNFNSSKFTDKLEIEFDQTSEISNKINYFNLSNISVSSEFPYGYSLDTNRIGLYYCEYITNHLFNIINTNKILFKVSNLKDDDDDLKISVICNSFNDDSRIKSLILDVFDFNLIKFKNEYLKNYDLSTEIDTQLSNKPWLVKDRLKDLILF